MRTRISEQIGIPEAKQCYSLDPLDLDEDSRRGRVKLRDTTNWPVKLKGDGFRLLTSAEWEYACRGGTRTPWSHGSDVQLLGSYSWFDQNGQRRTHEAAKLRPGPRGLFDMHGSNFEWVNDHYDGGLSVERDSDPIGSKRGRMRFARSGSFYDTATKVRSAQKGLFRPTFNHLITGFRVAVVP